MLQVTQKESRGHFRCYPFFRFRFKRPRAEFIGAGRLEIIRSQAYNRPIAAGISVCISI